MSDDLHFEAEAIIVDAATPSREARNPFPHGSKLRELLANPKLPHSDRVRVEGALERYAAWLDELEHMPGEGDALVVGLVAALNAYKRYVELDLIWDSEEAWLFRQRGQTKLDNSIMEEFLPWLIDARILPGLQPGDLLSGPRKAFAAASFTSTVSDRGVGGSLRVRTKDQDFALARVAYLRSSFDPGFAPEATSEQVIHLAYAAVECKTNLDKTMFQEASATAHDLRIAVPAARYFLMCEFLDMSPISTAGTDIDEVLILRGRRRGATARASDADPAVRVATRDAYIEWLDSVPIRSDVVLRFVNHLRALWSSGAPSTESVLDRGFF